MPAIDPFYKSENIFRTCCCFDCLSKFINQETLIYDDYDFISGLQEILMFDLHYAAGSKKFLWSNLYHWGDFLAEILFSFAN